MPDLPTEHARLDAAATTVRERLRLKAPPRVGLVLGSGLGSFADSLEGRTALPFAEVPGIPSAKVEGHAGNLVSGVCEGVPVVAMQGRVHLYEGHDVRDVVFGVRLMVRLGATTIVLTNAAGGIDASMSVGDLMVIDDHLNLTGRNCLTGPNEAALGVRFLDMTTAYDADLRALADRAARGLGFSLAHGVYAGLLGPTYETPAEIRMLRTLGAHAVGMSTVLETIAARHMGAKVLGLSCITNLAAGLGKGELSHEEVKETADRVRDRFVALLAGVLRGIGPA